MDWVHKQHRPVTLTFHLDQKCTYVKQSERKVTTHEQEVERTRTSPGFFTGASKSTETETIKVQKTVQQFHYQCETPYKFILSNGSDDMQVHVVQT